VEFFVSFKTIARQALSQVDDGFRSLDSFYVALSKADPPTRQTMLARLETGVAALPAAQRRLYERGLRRVLPGQLAASFRADVEAGTLPKVSYLVPSSVDSEHPSASSPSASAVLIYDILDALASSPQVWSRTVLLITFDEFDGYFDHVPPPVPPASCTEEFFAGKPLGLGFRVPMTVISPWSMGGFVSSETFDHAGRRPALTQPAPPGPPGPLPSGGLGASGRSRPGDHLAEQRIPRLPLRGLPVPQRTPRTQAPRRHVERLAIKGGTYRVAVHGPNGFLRWFTGRVRS
jgi:phospholipase C